MVWARGLLVVIDVQQRLVPAMAEFAPVLRNVRRLIRGWQVLESPIVVTEQYPRGLGPTVPSVAGLVPGPYLDKVAFSCFGSPVFREATAGHSSLILCGLEAHVCVLQTALDGLADGRAVTVVADAVTSREPLNRELALRQAAQAGATVTSTESVLFAALGEAAGERFKAISRLVR